MIPETVRNQLGLEPGTRFVVVARDDVVVFQKIEELDWKEFDRLLAEAHKQAREAGMKPGDVKEAIRKIRSR